MKLTLNWLKEYVDIEMPPHELGELLTMIGLEVEEIEPVGQSLENVVVAKISAIDPHPEADHLYVCQMDTGRGLEPVVCSAPNLEVGAVVPLAPPGTTLPGGATIRALQNASWCNAYLRNPRIDSRGVLWINGKRTKIPIFRADNVPGSASVSAF